MTFSSFFRGIGRALKAFWSPQCRVCGHTLGSNADNCNRCLEYWQDCSHGF